MAVELALKHAHRAHHPHRAIGVGDRAHHRAANALGQGPGVLHDLLAYAVADHLGAACVVGGHLDGDFTGALLELGQRPEPTALALDVVHHALHVGDGGAALVAAPALVSLAGGLDDLGGGGLGDLLPGLLGGLEAPAQGVGLRHGRGVLARVGDGRGGLLAGLGLGADVLLGHGRVVEVADDLLKLVGVAAGLGEDLADVLLDDGADLGRDGAAHLGDRGVDDLGERPARADASGKASSSPDDGQVHGVAERGGDLLGVQAGVEGLGAALLLRPLFKPLLRAVGDGVEHGGGVGGAHPLLVLGDGLAAADAGVSLLRLGVGHGATRSLTIGCAVCWWLYLPVPPQVVVRDFPVLAASFAASIDFLVGNPIVTGVVGCLRVFLDPDNTEPLVANRECIAFLPASCLLLLALHVTGAAKHADLRAGDAFGLLTKHAPLVAALRGRSIVSAAFAGAKLLFGGAEASSVDRDAGGQCRLNDKRATVDNLAAVATLDDLDAAPLGIFDAFKVGAQDLDDLTVADRARFDDFKGPALCLPLRESVAKPEEE